MGESGIWECPRCGINFHLKDPDPDRKKDFAICSEPECSVFFSHMEKRTGRKVIMVKYEKAS